MCFQGDTFNVVQQGKLPNGFDVSAGVHACASRAGSPKVRHSGQHERDARAYIGRLCIWLYRSRAPR